MLHLNDAQAMTQMLLA